MNIIALAGGVGGAKLADGLAQVVPPSDLNVIVNTGDDFEHLGLAICPDLDTVCYTLAGIANPETGWGRAGESWQALDSLKVLGGPTWFGLGDRDLGTHLERTRRLRLGEGLSQIVSDFCKAWGVGPGVFPMSDQPVRTWVSTPQGELAFQDYFVRLRCEPEVRGFRFEGAEKALPVPGALEAINEADLVIICPSNPWVSVDPILSVQGLRGAIEKKRVVAVSPIIGGQTVKGPAAKMYRELGIQPSALAVAQHYNSQAQGGLLSSFVLDTADAALADEITAMGMQVRVTNTIMKTRADRARLAEEVIAIGFEK